MLPALLSTANSTTKPSHPPTLIFSGATASVKGSATFGPFAMGKNAQRALAQSLAREFGPKGIHVSHVIIDGFIDIPMSKEKLKDKGEMEKINPETVSTYPFHVSVCRGGLHIRNIRRQDCID